MVGRASDITEKTIEMGIEYIRQHPEIRDVLLSGGDPLMVSDAKLEHIVSSLRAIPHLQVIRIGTKFPCVLPSRITDNLCNMLKKYHPDLCEYPLQSPSRNHTGSQGGLRAPGQRRHSGGLPDRAR